MKLENKKFIFRSFVFWRVLLFLFLFLAIGVVPLQQNFLGGGLSSYLRSPYLWAWGNFDGEHYLSIAYRGYQPLTYFFFPIYPLIVGFISRLFSQSFQSLAISGLVISNVSLLLALVGLWKLIRLDYHERFAKLCLVLLLIFPTAFYFGSVYTESLFLALAVWSFYFARKKKWVLAGLLGAFLTATRIVGIALVPALLIEAWLQRKVDKDFDLFYPAVGILLVPLGLLVYMYYLNIKTGDPLEFFHSVSIFGQQRSSTLILLPQVFYRYFFKILPSVNYSYFPVAFTTILEILVGLTFFVFSVIGFFRLRLSYAFYLAVGYLIPTFSGSFSSLPRYVLTLFPAFILFATWLSRRKEWVKVTVFIILVLALLVATSLFARGYWVA